MKKSIILLVLLISVTSFCQKKIDVLFNKPLFEVQPTMWGVFFEDINFAGDGGIYAELVKNRSFEFYKPFMGWHVDKQKGSSGKHFILNGDEDSDNPRFIRIINDNNSVPYSIYNEGFRGMGVKENLEYRFSVFARKFSGENPILGVFLTDDENNILGQTKIEAFSDTWKQYKANFKCSSTVKNARLKILVLNKGAIDLDMISLFPSDTWKERENGMRGDIMQMLADLEPGFVRFPGGCVVEGHDLSLRYQWKKTVGPLENRKLIVNRWNTEFMNRHTPDYFQSFGLGFYEYFLISEDLGAEPLPILNCGMACQYNTGELVPLDKIDPYIQDALDLIEFANGPVNSKWGKLRSDMGHPKPFNMKYLGIGNEQWGEQYVERYTIFVQKIREKYPEIKLVSGSGPSPNDDRFKYLWSKLPGMDVDLVDEHYYMNPNWFLANAKRYDTYDRTGPKIFAGEYAAHGPDKEYPSSRNTWLSALAEAAYLTGLERNADIVHMTSYAPLFAHLEAWQWRPDLIWFDNLNVFGTPNYYVQKMYSNHAGTHVTPVKLNDEDITGQDGLYASSTIDKEDNEGYLKLINTSVKKVEIMLNISGVKGNSVKIIEMASTNLLDYNSLENPEKVTPQEKEAKLSGKTFKYTLPAKSFSLFVFNL